MATRLCVCGCLRVDFGNFRVLQAGFRFDHRKRLEKYAIPTILFLSRKLEQEFIFEYMRPYDIYLL